MYSSTGDKWRVYGSIRLPHIFLGSSGACACNVYQALSPPPFLEGPGNEASLQVKVVDSQGVVTYNYTCCTDTRDRDQNLIGAVFGP